MKNISKRIVSVAFSILILFNISIISFSINITDNEVWGNKSETYELTEDICIKSGTSLTISEGVLVNGNGHRIKVYGTLVIDGANINNVDIVAANTDNDPCTITIKNSIVIGGNLLSPTGSASHVYLSLTNNHLKNLSSYSYIWYPSSDTYITGNIFESCGKLSIGSMNDVFITNNVFYCCQIENWAQYGSNCYVSKNTMIGTSLALKYSSGKMEAKENYWYGLNEEEVSSLITDGNTNYETSEIIEYLPVLTEPDSQTPDFEVPNDYIYNFYYDWSEDGKSCTATAINKKDQTIIITENGMITSAEKISSSCSRKGITTYTATFENNIFSTQTIDIEDIPLKEHVFENYIYNNDATMYSDGTETAQCENCTVKNTRIKTGTKIKSYIVTFKADDEIVKQIVYCEGADSIVEPIIPEKTGYIGNWESYSLNDTSFTVNAIYTPITYYATFIADGKQVGDRVPFTVESTSIKVPSVPDRVGYTGIWSNFELSNSNITITAVYTKILNSNENAIINVANACGVDYKNIVIITATASGIDEGYHLEIAIGNVVYKGNQTIVKAEIGEIRNDITYKVMVVKDDGPVQENLTKEGGKITCNDGFFNKIIAFLLEIFGNLKTTNIKPD